MDANWYPSLKAKNSKLCKDCNTARANEWKHKNPQSSREYAQAYYKKHPKYNVAWGRQNRLDIRREMITAYGGKCVVCGITDSRVLDIDHIDNNGAKERRQGMRGWQFYRWLRKHNYPKDNFQLLCRNCNWIKEIERRRRGL
jgi:hypothetical protein